MVNTNIRLIIFLADKDGEAIYSQEKLGTDYGSDHERLIAKFRFKLKKVGKTTGPFRYDWYQIPYDYTVEVTNRFKEFDLIDKSAWKAMDRGSWHCTGDSDQNHPQEKEMQKCKTSAKC